MTVSTINTGVTADLRRNQETQNKTNTALPYQPSAAKLPEDVINTPPIDPRPNVEAATAETAVQNRAAAQSTLNDADLDALFADRPVAKEEVAREPQQSVSAQANKLPPKILDLLAE